jgi:hypothetical protein
MYSEVFIFFDPGIPRFSQVVVDVITFGTCTELAPGPQ